MSVVPSIQVLTDGIVTRHNVTRNSTVLLNGVSRCIYKTWMEGTCDIHVLYLHSKIHISSSILVPDPGGSAPRFRHITLPPPPPPANLRLTVQFSPGIVCRMSYCNLFRLRGQYGREHLNAIGASKRVAPTPISTNS